MSGSSNIHNLWRPPLINHTILNGGTPNLHYARFSGFSSLSRVAPSFTNLKSLTIVQAGNIADEMTDLEAALTHISHSLTYFRFEALGGRLARPVRLPALKVLEIAFSQILPEISAPQFVKLSMRNCDDISSQQALFQNPSFPLLNCLCISQLYKLHFPPSIEFLLQCPALTILEFVHCTDELEIGVLKALSKSTSRTLLPHLRHLTLSCTPQ